LFFAGSIHADQSGSGREMLVHDDLIEIDFLGFKGREKILSLGIRADSSDEGDPCAEAGGGDGLVGSFAAGVNFEGVADDGLAGPWEAVAAKDVIGVDPAQHNDIKILFG
jgi:hypothetical protein